MSAGRTVPMAAEAEKSVLGGVIMAPETLGDLDTILDPADFYAESHQRLYALILAMHDRGEPVETASVTMEVLGTGKPDEYGGVHYVSGLGDNVPATTNLRYYATQVRRAAECRRVIAQCVDAMELAHSGKPSEARDLMMGEEAQSKDGVVHMSNVFGHIVSTDLPDRMDQHRSGKKPGLNTPWHALTRMISPELGHLVIVAARPAMGKSALVTEWCRNAAAHGVGSVQFNLEMTKEEVGYRMIAPAAGVSSRALTEGFATREELVRVTQAAEAMADHPLYILDTPGLTVEAIRRKSRRLIQQDRSIRIVAVDYLQLVGATDKKRAREEQIAHVSRSLKAMAKELRVVVIALAQLNRGVETRKDKHPTMADLRESGQIEQDADLIMFLMRPGYYDDTEGDDVHLDIAKQRKGATGRVVLRWAPETTWFADQFESGNEPPWRSRGN